MCENERTPEDECAIGHWRAVKRSVLQGLLDDTSETVITAARVAEKCEREIARLTITIKELHSPNHTKAQAMAVERRWEFVNQLVGITGEAAEGKIIVAYLRRQIARCGDA
jgi:hypothetical protein